MGRPTIKYTSCNSFFRVKRAVVKQLNKGLLYWSRTKEAKNCNVKGHFSVLTLGDGEPIRFLVALSYLAYPPFVELLEAAAKEFGFNQEGVLAIPCQASQLQRILSSQHFCDDCKEPWESALIFDRLMKPNRS